MSAFDGATAVRGKFRNQYDKQRRFVSAAWLSMTMLMQVTCEVPTVDDVKASFIESHGLGQHTARAARRFVRPLLQME